MEKFDIIRTSTTKWQGATTVEANTLEEAIELAQEVDEEDWADFTESDGGYSYTEEATYFLVAYAGEYTKVHANTRASGLYQAQQDYQLPPAKRLLDWKDSEHTAEEWDITASSI